MELILWIILIPIFVAFQKFLLILTQFLPDENMICNEYFYSNFFNKAYIQLKKFHFVHYFYAVVVAYDAYERYIYWC